MAKRKKKGVSGKKLVFTLVIVIILVIVGVFGYGPISEFLEKDNGDTDVDNTPKPPIVVGDSMTVHFMELGNDKTGDATLVKVGNVEILIDAGSRKNSAKALKTYIDQYCEDGVLEYVIATHAHQDHIAAFVGSKTDPGIFDSYVVQTLIDFPKTNSTSAIYGEYLDKRDAEIKAGATHYTALECYNEEKGAKRIYDLGQGAQLEILYQKFYEEKTSDENDYSVCVMITQGENNFLLTGDLEAEGEESLVESNKLPKVDVFKGGHHGSGTSTSETLLSVIEPDMVCVCACAGSDEYTDNTDNMFPAKAFVDRVTKYTDKIYVTTIVSDNKEGFESLNGNIVVTSDKNTIRVNCSNNNTVFQDTEWYKKYRKTA